VTPDGSWRQVPSLLVALDIESGERHAVGRQEVKQPARVWAEA